MRILSIMVIGFILVLFRSTIHEIKNEQPVLKTDTTIQYIDLVHCTHSYYGYTYHPIIAEELHQHFFDMTIIPGYIKRNRIAWFGTHRHIDGNNQIYSYSYLYRYVLDLPRGSKTLTLPDNPRIRIFAVTLRNEGNANFTPAAPLYDDFDNMEVRDVQNLNLK